MPVTPNSRQFYHVYQGRVYRFTLDKNLSTFNLPSTASSEEIQISGDFKNLIHIYPLDESSFVLAGQNKQGKNCTWLYGIEGQNLNSLAQISDNIPISLESDLHITYLLTSESTIELWDHKLSQPFKKNFDEQIIAIEINRKLGILAAFGEKNIHLLEDETVNKVKHDSLLKLSNDNIHPLAWGPLKTLVIGGDRVVRYISGSKWSIYSFQTVLGSSHSTRITLARFLLDGENTLLITMSNDSLIVWDFDEEAQLKKIDKSLSWPSMVDFFQDDGKIFLYYITVDPNEFHIESITTEKNRRNILKRVANYVDNDAEDSPVQEELFNSPTKHSLSTHSSLDDDDNTIVGPEYQDNSLHSLVINLKQRIQSLESTLGKTHKNNGDFDMIITPGQCPPPIDAANQWCMFWNQLGHVSKSCVLGNQTIHVYMFSGPHAGNIKIADKYNCSLVSLETEGYALSADIQESDASHSIILFSLFSGAATWERRTCLGETVKAISLGLTFLAVVTSTNTLYIFSPGGSLLLSSQLSGPCIALAGHGPLLIVITQVSGGNGDYFTYQHTLYLVDSVRGYSRDRGGCITTLSRETFAFQNTNNSGIDWINISDNLICHIRFQGIIYGLYPTSIDLTGQFILQWVPLINMLDIGNFVNSLLFPLYIELDRICYIKLRPGHVYPTSNVPVNFFGYTLIKSYLRIDSVSSSLPLKKYNSLLSADSQLREMVKDDDGKMKMVDDIVALDWRNYDEMRYRLSLYANQFSLVSLFQHGALDLTTNMPIEDCSDKINECNKLSDKWALRIIRKTAEDKKTQCTAREAIYMIKGSKGLDIAASIIGPINQKFVDDARNIKLRKIDT